MRVRIFILSLLLAATAQATRIKDVAHVQGPAEVQLIGYGMVVGLRGTGDGPLTKFTTQSVINLLRNMGIEMPASSLQLQVRNAAAVMVTGTLSPYLKEGATIDVTVSSMGDAKSLEGGTLLLTPLQGPDGEVYAQAQGPLSIGGMAREGNLGLASYTRNHPMVGDIPGGGLVEKEAAHEGLDTAMVRLDLESPDFTSAVSMAKAIDQKFGAQAAQANDPATVSIQVPQNWRGRIMEFVAGVENLDFTPSHVAKVVLNEKTGTVIAGGDVTISEVAVAHGNITVEIKQNQQTQLQTAAAPGAVTQQSATNVSENIHTDEGKAEMRVMPASTSVTDLAKSLNTLGVTPRDIIAIFEAIKEAGALNAELVVM